MYVDSGMRVALRRVERRRAEAQTAGSKAQFDASLAAEILAAARAAGIAPRGGRQVTVRISADPAVLESALWVTGARSVRELATIALLDIILATHRARRFAERHQRLRARRGSGRQGGGPLR
jgi:hypothetical protein